MQSIYGNDETKKFFKNSVEGSNYTKDIIQEYNIDCDVTGDSNYVVAHHPNKFKDIKEQATAYREEFGIETEIYSKEDFDKVMIIDREEGKRELLGHQELFEKVYDKLPKEFFYMRELLLSALWRSPEKWGQQPE